MANRYTSMVSRAGTRRMRLPEDWSVIEGWTAAKPPFFGNSVSETDSSNNKILGAVSAAGATAAPHYSSEYQEITISSE
jgi:hypothetical protein